MERATIFHNPRCSKSRATLELLQSRGIETTVVEYLKDPPSEPVLRDVLEKLGMRPKDIVRRGEPAFAELGLAERLEDDAAVVRALLAEPSLIERPIVVIGDRARIGRPPEKVLEIVG